MYTLQRCPTCNKKKTELTIECVFHCTGQRSTQGHTRMGHCVWKEKEYQRLNSWYVCYDGWMYEKNMLRFTFALPSEGSHFRIEIQIAIWVLRFPPATQHLPCPYCTQPGRVKHLFCLGRGKEREEIGCCTALSVDWSRRRLAVESSARSLFQLAT